MSVLTLSIQSLNIIRYVNMLIYGCLANAIKGRALEEMSDFTSRKSKSLDRHFELVQGCRYLNNLSGLRVLKDHGRESH